MAFLPYTVLHLLNTYNYLTNAALQCQQNIVAKLELSGLKNQSPSQLVQTGELQLCTYISNLSMHTKTIVSDKENQVGYAINVITVSGEYHITESVRQRQGIVRLI